MDTNKHFFILDDHACDDEMQILNLRNPATGKATKYLIKSDAQELYELNCFAEKHRSWFINESVCSNGKIFMPSRMDPLFLIIPYLQKSNQAIPLEDMLVDEEYPHTKKLIGTVLKGGQLCLIADEKSAGSIRAYKYNEEKTLNWLSKKCDRLEAALGSTQKFARSQNFVKEEKENEKQDCEMLQYSHGIISDYLSLELSKKLGTFLSLPEEKVQNKRKSTAEIEISQIKKVKKEELNETTPVKKLATDKKVSAKSKALAKAASGTKSIANFFNKK